MFRCTSPWHGGDFGQLAEPKRDSSGRYPPAWCYECGVELASGARLTAADLARVAMTERVRLARWCLAAGYDRLGMILLALSRIPANDGPIRFALDVAIGRDLAEARYFCGAGPSAERREFWRSHLARKDARAAVGSPAIPVPGGPFRARQLMEDGKQRRIDRERSEREALERICGPQRSAAVCPDGAWDGRDQVQRRKVG